MELAPAVVRKLCKELRDLTTEKAIDGIKVLVDEQVGTGRIDRPFAFFISWLLGAHQLHPAAVQNIMDIQAEIDGPTGTPFEGGTFRMRLCLPADFPQAAPKVCVKAFDDQTPSNAKGRELPHDDVGQP
jgi:hypothetical protein